MNKHLGILIVAVGLTFIQTQTAVAAENKADSSSLAEQRNNQQISLGGGWVADYRYEEPGLMSLTGQMTRYEAGYRRLLHLKNRTAWWAADASYTYGNLRYDGGVSNLLTGQTTPVSYRADDKILVVRGRFGLSLFDTGDRVVNVYLGLGVWDLKDRSVGPGTYDREITYFYLPVGAEYVAKWGFFSWVSSMEMDHQIIGVVQTHLSDANPNYPDLTDYQVLGWGAKVSTAAEFDTGPFSIIVDAYYQFWTMNESSKSEATIAGQTVYFSEPKNDTEMVGVDLGVRF